MVSGDTTFEVYQKSGDRWIFRGSFQGSERNDALRHAKSIERGGLNTVKVVEESATSLNRGRESIIYFTGNAKLDFSTYTGRRTDIDFGPRKAETKKQRKARYRKEGRKARSSAVNLSLGLVVGVVCGVLAFGVMQYVLNFVNQEVPILGRFLRSVYDVFTIGAFTLGFALGGLPFLKTGFSVLEAFRLPSLPRFSLSLGTGHQIAPAYQPAFRPMPGPPARAKPKLWRRAKWDNLAKDDDELFGEVPKDFDEIIEDDDHDRIDEENPNVATQTDIAAAESAVPSRASADGFRGYVARTIEATKLLGRALDQRGRFGVCLYLGGALKSFMAANPDLMSHREALYEALVEASGTSTSAATFATKIETDYANDPAYSGMLRAGAEAAKAFIEGEHFQTAAATECFRRWTDRPSAGTDAQVMTVLFTDIVGSTAMTQTLGDALAQEIIRRHDAIVRTALGYGQGREIKHMGDGIMAVFPTAAGAVRTSQAILKGVQAHSQQFPDMPFALKIGMSTGKPIVENNDVYGSTVQLAARVCAKAGPNEILISGQTKSALPSGQLTFANRGEHKLKGFKQPIALFAVH